MQTKPIRKALNQQASKVFDFVSKLAVSFSFAYAMRLSLPSAILFGLFFTTAFLISGSIARGLTNFFLSIALTSVLSSTLFLFKFEIDRPSMVFLTTALLTIAISYITAKEVKKEHHETPLFESIIAIVLVASAHLFHQLTNLESTKLFSMLLKEDNAAWIHASSGFLRFNASAGLVTSMEYGSGSLTSNLLSFISSPTSFLSSENSAVLSLANVANTYVFLLIALIYISSATCREIFHVRTQSRALRNTASNGKFVLIGVFSVISVGKVFLYVGHLSLILSLVFFWVVTYQLRNSSGSLLQISRNQDLWNSNLAMLSAFTVGVVWFPLIPISVLTMLVITVALASNIRHSMFHLSRALKNKCFIGNIILLLLILLAAITQFHIPTGYSISSLININTGGTLTPTAIGLSIAFLGFVFAINSEGKNVVLSLFISLFPLGHLAYWVASMSVNPVSPGYSVEKFGLLVSLIGLPLFIGYIFGVLERVPLSNLSFVIAPLFFVFAVLHSTWGINSFPRFSVLERSNWTINYLNTLIDQSALNPTSQILCLGPNLESDTSAYTCSRFASALQFREFSDDNLARSWRSQILELTVDTNVFPEGTKDFDVPSRINTFLNNGGEFIVILTPGPFWQIEQRADQPWMQELPWPAIKIIQ